MIGIGQVFIALLGCLGYTNVNDILREPFNIVLLIEFQRSRRQFHDLWRGLILLRFQLIHDG